MGYPADIVLEALEITDNILEDAITIVAQKFLHKNSSKGKQLDLDWDPLKRDLSNGYFQEVIKFTISLICHSWEVIMVQYRLSIIS